MSNQFDKGLSRVEYATDTLAIINIFACMILASVDVFCRYVLNAPLPWATDVLTLYILPGIFFFGLPGSYSRGAHVAVDIILSHVSDRQRLWLSVLSRIIAIVVFVAIAWFGAERTIEAFQSSEIVPSPTMSWLVWPSVLLVPLGTTLALIRAIERLVAEAVALGRGDAAVSAILMEAPHQEGLAE
jgi:TRAP-type C4-dicarboxylate transport system permease small subunit